MVVLNHKYIVINKGLAKYSNRQIKRFNELDYSRPENVDSLLLKKDITIEKKKNALIKQMHDSIIEAFSIDKKKFSKKVFESLKKRLCNIRKLIAKLRSINYYLETSFLEDLKAPKIKIIIDNQKPERDNLAGDELEMLEYTAYKLIGEVIMLDKKSLQGYTEKTNRIMKKEAVEIHELGSLLRRESIILEHLEAKLPPPRLAGIKLLKEPIFTHWTARIFALLSYLKYLCSQEHTIFGYLKKNKELRKIISKKIKHLVKEKSALLRLMEEKASTMRKFRHNNNFKRELHNLTATVGL